jgi:anthranilate 1,2-dioxygenase small subunit
MSDGGFRPSLDPREVPDHTSRRIAALIADCAAVIDGDQLELWPGFFTEKCVYRIIARADFDKGRPIGFVYCDNRDMLADRVRAMRSANVFQPHTYRHVLGAPRILGSRDATFDVETSYVVIRTAIPEGTMMVFSAGRYLDEIVFDGDAPKFRSRSVVTDSESIDMLLVLPI